MNVLDALLFLSSSMEDGLGKSDLVDVELADAGAYLTFERGGHHHIFRINIQKVGMTETGAFE
jgi:hypothetical protein